MGSWCVRTCGGGRPVPPSPTEPDPHRSTHRAGGTARRRPLGAGPIERRPELSRRAEDDQHPIHRDAHALARSRGSCRAMAANTVVYIAATPR